MAWSPNVCPPYICITTTPSWLALHSHWREYCDKKREGGMGNQEELLIQKVTEIYEKLSTLPNLSPSKDVNLLFTQLVLLCIPPTSMDVTKLNNGVQEMRSKLISLCGEAEGLLESHYSSILGSFDYPLDHLNLFPYFQNYIKLSLLEYGLLARHTAKPPARVAFVGSGPLPLTSIVLATRHLRDAYFVNYDIDGAANKLAARLVEEDEDLAVRMEFRTADIMEVTEELREYEVVFLAALVGMGREEKGRVVAHLTRYMAPGAVLMVRSAHGARAFLYPVVDDLRGFEVLAVHHPADEVINSVIVAKKQLVGGGQAAPVPPVLPCNCCGMEMAMNGMGHHGGINREEIAIEEQLS